MRPLDLLKFAAQSLRRSRMRSSMMLLAVAIGVAAVIMLTALGEGARRYVTSEFSSLGTNLVIVIPGRTATGGVNPALMSGDTPRDLTLGDLEAVRRLPTVADAAPLVIGQGTVSSGRRERETTVLGTTASWLNVRQWKVERGEFLPESQSDRGGSVCVIGAKIVRELYPDGSAIGQWLRIGDRRFRIIGIMGTEGRSVGFDAQEVVMIPVASALTMYNKTSLFRILAQARDHDQMLTMRAQMIEVLRKRHQNEEDVTVVTQDAMLATFNGIFGALTAALAGIAGISLLVAGILIMNVMLVAVSQRTAEVGLLKALGAKSRQITSVFLTEAVLLAALGGVIGLLIGEAATALMRRLLPIEAVAPRWATISALVIALLSGLIFGIVPARRAARLNPVLALSRKI
jgi:putative ABC transport system permease protein